MGVTISSKRYSCDMGYGGFGKFRNVVAEKVDDEFYRHYLKLSSPGAMFLFGDARKDYFEKYDAITRKYINQNTITIEVANFLYQSDCEGEIDRQQAKQIYELIKEYDDNIILAYVGRSDCTKMYDMKKIFADGTKVKWS